MSYHIKKISSIILLLFFLASPPLVALAQLVDSGSDTAGPLRNFASKAGFRTDNESNEEAQLADYMGMIIKGFLSLMGIVFIILIISSGYSWMTARGDESKVTKAKDTISRAVIGLIIVVSAYAITGFVFKALGDTAGGGSAF